MSDDHLISLAGDMWNELENLRDLWTGTDREPQCEQLIADYESLAGVARGADELVQWLDHVAQAQGRTRAETVRWLLTQAKDEDNRRTQHVARDRVHDAMTQFQLGRITKDEARQAFQEALLTDWS